MAEYHPGKARAQRDLLLHHLVKLPLDQVPQRISTLTQIRGEAQCWFCVPVGTAAADLLPMSEVTQMDRLPRAWAR